MRDGVSVLIPVYNGARYLSECLRSVCDQTLPPAEIIVIDDGSEDDTPKVAGEWVPRIVYKRVAHGGLPYVRNHALKFADTEFVAFIDSDDVWLPDKLERQMEAMSQEARPAAVFGYVQQFVSEDLAPEEADRLKVDAKPIPGLFASTLLMRKADCDRVGPFDETLRTGEFIEWFSRATDLGIETLTVPAVVCRRRIHLNNMGRGGAAAHGRDYVRMLKKILDRRRNSPPAP